MKKIWLAGMVVLCAGVLVGTTARADDDDSITLRATMRGASEVPPINSAASGNFRATIHSDGTIDFTLTYTDLSTLPIFSHIHFAPTGVAGGVMIFLCGGGGQPACPAATSGTVTGTITPANVTGPAAQGVTAGDLASALRIIIQQGEGYANLHSTMFPGGEIRGQVKTRSED